MAGGRVSASRSISPFLHQGFYIILRARVKERMRAVRRLLSWGLMEGHFNVYRLAKSRLECGNLTCKRRADRHAKNAVFQWEELGPAVADRVSTPSTARTRESVYLLS